MDDLVRLSFFWAILIEMVIMVREERNFICFRGINSYNKDRGFDLGVAGVRKGFK